MINRELIRLKVVQICYAFHQNEGRDMEVAEKELMLSMSKSYEMYNLLLLLLTEIGRMAQRYYEVRVNRLSRLGMENKENPRFVNNLFLRQLEENQQLRSFADSCKYDWSDEYNLVRNLYQQVENAPFFQTYMEQTEQSYEADRDVCRQIYRTFICNNDQLDELFEGRSLYWNDDKAIVDTFVLKTINRFTAGSTADQPLLPQFQDDTVQEFAVKLLRHTISNAAYYDRLISGQARNWTLERIALMDRVIMQVALAEILTFPSIPLSVSINEYVELAKLYSTPKSGKYVNATLDHIAKSLMEEGKIAKDQ